MYINNGGVRYRRNAANTTIASGVWSLGDIHLANLDRSWNPRDAESGWFGGGAGSTVLANVTVERIVYSNDLSVAIVRNFFNTNRTALAATGNESYGWFGGGSPGIQSKVDRVDYTSDLNVASVRGPLVVARYALSAAGNENFGWFGGGYDPSFLRVSTVDRIDYINDSSTATSRGPLNLLLSHQAASGDNNYAWFGGGWSSLSSPASITTVCRIDYSNDSNVSSIRGPLTLARSYLASTGNSNFGWFGGGISQPGSLRFSTVDRIDYANDSITATTRGALTLNKNSLTATGNTSFGWFGGGAPGPISSVDRIDYSNDVNISSSRSPLSFSRSGFAATGGFPG